MPVAKPMTAMASNVAPPRRKPATSQQAQSMAQAYCLDESQRGCGGRR
jgi:hypothetical protein